MNRRNSKSFHAKPVQLMPQPSDAVGECPVLMSRSRSVFSMALMVSMVLASCSCCEASQFGRQSSSDAPASPEFKQ